MQYVQFKNIFKNYIVFSNIEIEKLIGSFNKKNLINWQKKGYIKKVRNNWYCFSDVDYQQSTLNNIANKIYKPSYISLESALSYYAFIPEGVFSITSITTSKTNIFNSTLATFVYQSIKESAFFGYEIVENQNIKFCIAKPEKALLDYLHLNTNVKSEDDFTSLRLNKSNIKARVNFDKMKDYAVLFDSNIIFTKINKLKKHINAKS